MSKDYNVMARMYVSQNIYRRNISTMKFPENTPCCLCHVEIASIVLFPCDHLCICKSCLDNCDIGPYDCRKDKNWHACPVCMTEISLVLSFADGNEYQEYSNWVFEVKPKLPFYFEKTFKLASSQINDHKVSSSISCCIN